VASGEHNAAMIYFGRGQLCGAGLRKGRALNQSTAACRTPIGNRLFGKQSVTLAADPFHDY